MSEKEKTPISVITIPLKTEKWQEDVLSKRFNSYRQIYNAMLGYELKRYDEMVALPEYIEANQVVKDTYKKAKAEADEKEISDDGKIKIKKTPEFKEASQKLNEIRGAYGFSEYQFTKVSNIFRKTRADRLEYLNSEICKVTEDKSRRSKSYTDGNLGLVTSSRIAVMSIGIPMWSAFAKKLFCIKDEDDLPMPHFKKSGSFTSLASDGKSGLRILDENGDTTLNMSSDRGRQYYAALTSKRGKNVIMPLVIDRNNTYLLEMMERKIHVVRLLYKKVKGNYKYYIQLSVSGAPALKYDKDGNLKHSIKDDKIAVVINSSKIAVATSDDVYEIFLEKNFESYNARIAEINQYLDKSRRISNPENYNEDGTCKKKAHGEPKNIWTNSVGYKKAQAEKSNLQRIMKEQRKIQNNIIANEILSMGSTIYINDYKAAECAKRKEETPMTKKGTYASKAKAGKRIGENAPGQLMTLIDNKLEAAGYDKMHRVKYDKEEHTKKDIKELARALYNEKIN